MQSKSKRILSYAIFGFILGLFFPVVATIGEIIQFGVEFSWATIQGLHLGQPLMLIIDVAPIVFAASFALIGIQAARFHETSQLLDNQIQEQQKQAQNEQYFLEALMASTSFAIVRLDTRHHIINCNQAFEDLFGYSCEEIIGEHLDDMIAADELYSEASAISDSVSDGNLVRKISQRKRKDGSLVDVEIVGVPVTVGGEKIGIMGLYHDISQRVLAEKSLQESESRFRSLFDESPISLWEEDFSGAKKILEALGSKEEIITRLSQDYELVNQCLEAVKVLDINQATVELYNAKSKADLIQSLSQVLVIESLEEFRQELIALVNGATSYECEIYQKKLTGELIYGWLRLSVPAEYEDTWERVQISIVDITERKEAEEKLRFISFHDALTGLYNRAYFEEEVERLSGSRKYPISIITCDLDGLKQINDQQGHDAGDRAIQSAAKVLGYHTFRKEDMVARIGGDEFIIILPAVDLDQTPKIMKRIVGGVEQFNNSQIDDGMFRPISLSFGHAVVYENGSLEEGYKTADTAMYKNKTEKKQSRA